MLDRINKWIDAQVKNLQWLKADKSEICDAMHMLLFMVAEEEPKKELLEELKNDDLQKILETIIISCRKGELK